MSYLFVIPLTILYMVMQANLRVTTHKVDRPLPEVRTVLGYLVPISFDSSTALASPSSEKPAESGDADVVAQERLGAGMEYAEELIAWKKAFGY